MISKERARRLFIEHGLERLPTAALTESTRLHDVFPDADLLTVRAASDDEAKNLPRIVGADRDAVQEFLDRNGTRFRYIVQPYEQITHSVELLIDLDGFYCEIMPGIWELDTVYVPDVLAAELGSPDVSISCPHTGLIGEVARFLFGNGPQRLVTHASDAFFASTHAWILANWEALNSIRLTARLDSIGFKLHYGSTHGFSPQNIRTDLPTRPSLDLGALDLTPEALLGVGELPPTQGTRVVQLTSGAAREAAADLVSYGRRLVNHGVQTVIIPSGLLSHMAILLRECGLQTVVARNSKTG